MLIETKIFNSYKKAYNKNFSQSREVNIIVMLSAGVDSVALAHFVCKNKNLLKRLFSTENVNIKLYHFNHKLRKQNDIMEQKAKQLASFLNTEICVQTATQDCSTEQKARIERFRFLEDFKGVVLTAHHLNDCVESYLMNVFRGHEDHQPIPFFTKVNVACIVHLLLFTEKQSLKDYVNFYKLIDYVVEDETNFITKGSRRNFVRNKLLPLLTDEDIILNNTLKRKMYNKLNSL
jgi:tRNA(Ile)-lysidine synthetase-like protein